LVGVQLFFPDVKREACIRLFADALLRQGTIIWWFVTSLMLLVEHEIRPKSEEGASAKMPVEDPIILNLVFLSDGFFPLS
jgi:hypothetical protein